VKRTALKRKKPMRRRSSRRVRRKTAAERAHLDRVHASPCAGDGRLFVRVDSPDMMLHLCDGPIQAAHFRNMTGVGRKESDLTTIPLCRSLHEQYDQAKGVFAGWGRDARKQWHLARQAEFSGSQRFAQGGG
jgi:hypothetical protein